MPSFIRSGPYVFKVPGVRGDSCPDLESCQGGDCGQNFRSRGGIVLVWQKFQVRTPKNKAVFLAFLARFARKIFFMGWILSWPGLFQRGESCPDLDFFRGGSTTTFWTSGGGLSWPVIDPCTCMYTGYNKVLKATIGYYSIQQIADACNIKLVLIVESR